MYILLMDGSDRLGMGLTQTQEEKKEAMKAEVEKVKKERLIYIHNS